MVSYQNLIMSNISHVNATGTWYSELQTPSAKLQTPNSKLRTDRSAHNGKPQTDWDEQKERKKKGGAVKGEYNKVLATCHT